MADVFALGEATQLPQRLVLAAGKVTWNPFLSSVEEQSVTSSLDLAPCLAISFLATSNLSQPAPLPFFQPLNPLLSDTDASQAAPGWREKIGRFEIVLGIGQLVPSKKKSGISNADWSHLVACGPLFHQFAELRSQEI